MMNHSPAGPSAQLPGASVQEYSIKVPSDTKKKFHCMRFNGNLNIDFTKWNQVKLERENNMREMRVEEEQPKFGAGSEFGRDAKDEARRKKFGIIAKKYKPEDQPWILKSGGKTGKKFRGVREGGVGDNAAYYVFTHGPDGSIEAFPLNEWYNFQPIQRYKALSAEEAEEEFGRRNKVMNYFSLMLQKRLKNTEEGELEEEGELKKGTKKKGKKEKDLKISELDEWMDSDASESSDEDGGKKEDDEDGEEKKKKKKKKELAKKNLSKKKKKGSDESAFEESDDGDEEGRELDYISDSSEDISDHDEKARKEMSGVTEEKALRKLLNSDDEDDDEEEDSEDEDKNKSEPEDDKEDNETPNKEKKKKKKTKDKKTKGKEVKEKEKETSKEKDKEVGGEKEKNEESASSVSSDSSDDESKKKTSTNKTANVGKPTTEANNTESNNNAKRAIAAAGGSVQDNPAKKARMDPINFNDSGISEEAVRRYLIRKPMTATELLQKFKRPKTNLSSEQLVTVMTSILKRINPTKQTIKNKMYLSLKPS